MLRRTIVQLALFGAIGLSAYVAHSQSATGRTRDNSQRTGLDRLTYTTFQRPSNWDIYLFQRSGQTPRRLTTDPGLDYDPVVSPDGRWLVFCSERRGNPDLYVLDLQASDGEPRLLVDSDALEDQASFSPDSQSIAFVSTFSGNAEVYVLPFEPGTTKRMTDASNLTRHQAGDFRPAFSPNGREVAFSSDRDLAVRATTPINRERASDIYVIDVRTQVLRRLTDAPGWDGSPKWSADGTQIVFYSQRGTDLNGRLRQSKVWMMASDGSNQRVVTDGESVAVSPEFLPDGRIIYSRRTAAGTWEIVFLLELNEDGSPGTMRRLTNNTGQKGHLGFSWDGKWLIFASEEGGISDETPLAGASQPYGELFAYRIIDGTTVRLSHNKWEEGIPSWQRGLAVSR